MFSVQEPDALDRAFQALADPVRRAIVVRLCTGDATVKQLAEPFPITKQAISRHIQVLEHAGLVTRRQERQRRLVHLDPAALEQLTVWINRQRLVADQTAAPYFRITAYAAEDPRADDLSRADDLALVDALAVVPSAG
jgi:DNA-binding transcriptional ArsR family regulator